MNASKALLGISLLFMSTTNNAAERHVVHLASNLSYLLGGGLLLKELLDYGSTLTHYYHLKNNQKTYAEHISLRPFAPAVLQNMLVDICKKIALDHTTIELRVDMDPRRAHWAGAAADSILNSICIGKKFLELPEARQQAILSHELLHLKNDDSKKLLLFNGSVLATATAFMRPSLLQYFLIKLVQNTYLRFIEKRADTETAQLLGNATDLINLYEQRKEEIATQKKLLQSSIMSNPTDLRKLCTQLSSYIPLIIPWFNSHPTPEQRIEYLKPFVQ